MLVAPAHGFVMIAMPKCASTAIEKGISRFAEIELRGHKFKHMNYAGFARHLEPLLAARGYARTSYEVISLFREPIDWMFSWWRYRARDELADPTHHNHHHFTGNVDFETFAFEALEGSAPYAKLGRQSRMIRSPNGGIGVDRLFRYENLDSALEYLSERIGKRLKLSKRNVSPRRPMELSAEARARLEVLLEDDYKIYRSITDHGQFLR